ncbi:MAG TPA: tetratricopeptide repeat protein [Geobacteraceae bacterium]
MSSKKDKFLESAQKFILKGQLDRAIKDYEQVVALDPNDIRHRQRLAELLVRAGRRDEAIGEYEAIGKYYADNAFYLKAIAVYKQIQKLDPDDIKISHHLAILNEKQGLTGNALAEYGRVCNYYDKSGKHSEALSIIEKMMAMDPDNLNTRLKLAETHFAAGNAGKAYDDFVQVALLLRNRGDESVFRQVCDRVAYLFPGKKEFALDLASSQLAGGDAASTISKLREITEKEPENLHAWQLLAAAVRTAGEREELRTVCQKMARLFPDELSPREGLIQSAIDDDNIESALFLLKLHGPLFLEKGAYQSLERSYLVLLDRMPEDARPLDGLKGLYEASGEQAKLSGIVARLASLARDEAEREGAVDAEEEVHEQETSSAAGAPVAAAEPAEPVPGTGWEEEIDLSLEEEDSLGADVVPIAVRDATLFEDEPVPDEPEEPAEVAPELDLAEERDEVEMRPAEPAEVALELELTEDELVELAGLYGQPAQEEADFGDMPPEAAEEAAFPLDDAGGPPAGDDFIELEAEHFAAVESEEASLVDDYDKHSPDGLFSAFKKEELDDEDTETHYNLGIAYKEMGLYDDAMAEFRSASLDPRRKVDCLILQGICCRDKGDFNSAEEIFRQGIALEEPAAAELSPLKYELALLYDIAGRKEDALLLYCEINALNPGFRDTVERIEKLAGLPGDEVREYDDLDLVELDWEDE